MGNSNQRPKSSVEVVRKKIIVVGDGTTGKTSLITRYVEDAFYEDTPQAYIPSSMDIKTKTLHCSKKKVEITIYDLGGQETFEHLRKTYCPNSDGIIISFCLENPVSLQNVEKVWVPEMKKTCPGVPALLVGNKRDLRDDAEQADGFVKESQGKKMAKKLKMKGYLECSSLLDEGVGEVFDTVCSASLSYKPKKKKSVDEDR